METKSFPRAGNPPHMPSLASALTPLLAVANAGSFHIFTGTGVIFIEQAGWSGVDLVAVQAAVDAAPNETTVLRVGDQVDDLSPLLKSAFMSVLDSINVLRGLHSLAPITYAQFVAYVKNKAATLY